MHAASKRITSALTFMICAGFLLIGAGSSTLFAQRFESTFGGPQCGATGYGGVQHVSTGGYIAVGESASDPDGGCTNMNVYVVRTEEDGSLAWSRTYDFGGDDHGFSIREVKYDPSGQGGFIITGYTEKSVCGESDLLLLRISSCGDEIWANTYGDPNAYELGWDVVEASTQGDPDYGTRQGDFIAAGFTTRNPNGQYDGYLVRVDGSSGSLIWGVTYDGPGNGQDFFQSVDEATFYNDGSTGDIVAAGGSSSYGTSSIDGWIVRVDGNTGRFGGGLQGAAAYGRDRREEFWSIQELKIGAYAGELVAVGTSNSIAGGADVYIVQTSPHPCELRNDRVFGDLGWLSDEGYCVREIPFGTPSSNPGDLIVTGTMMATREAREDVFLAKVEVGSLNRLGPIMLYGESRFDAGWSVSPVIDKDNPDCITNGFVVAGGTTSLGSNPPVPAMYLIKTDDDLRDDCTNRVYDVPEEKIWEWACEEPSTDDLWDWCHIGFESACQYWENRICLDREVDCRIERCECSDGKLKRNLPESPETGKDALSLSSYPNPVKAGSPITLQYTLMSDATMTVTVSDLSGRTIVSQEIAARSGSSSYGLSTEGWSSGTYMVSVTADGHSSSTRVVVTK